MILAVRSDSVVDVQGTLAGQALHFEREADGFHALGGVPFGSDSAVARVVRSYADGVVDTATVPLPVRRRRLPGERLRVAPEFARPPDSLKERIRLESELVDGVRERAHETPRLWHEPFERPRTSVITSGFELPRLRTTMRSLWRGLRGTVGCAGPRNKPRRRGPGGRSLLQRYDRAHRSRGRSCHRLLSPQSRFRRARRHGRARPGDRPRGSNGTSHTAASALVGNVRRDHSGSAGSPQASAESRVASNRTCKN